MPRTEWDALPSAVRVAVGGYVGAVTGWVPVAEGLTCQTAAVLATADGRVFVKGVPVSDTDGVVGQDWEVAANPLVAGVAPLLLARVTVAGWDVLVFEYIDGRHADLTPGSADTALVARALARMQEVTADGLAPRLGDRYAHVLSDDEQLLLAGDALLHTDTNPHNLLIGASGARVVDWAMVASGPAWVDVALTAVRLMEAGWPDEAAVAWAGRFPSWRSADPVAVAALVAGVCRDWEARLGPDAARPSNLRYQALLGTAAGTRARRFARDDGGG
ncbi:phosphotransferase [Streptomyces sp. NPDC008317]|uniref:phosphotransferase n=1 Tax=Streptomyces sp. NPDC008317 TaxID=3364827 RepID=UPI0036E9D3A3